MKIHTGFDQGSLDWLRVRCGKATASEFDSLVNVPSFSIKGGKAPRTYLTKKLAEAWRGEPLPQFNSWQTDHGNIVEENARAFFELEYNCEIQQVSFIETDDGLAGCSPDGLIGEDGGIEIKCPQHPAHVGYLLDGTLPEQYAAQVHGCMYVTGRKWWVFLSYRTGLPPFVLSVKRDEAIQRKIMAALDTFNAEFAAGMAKLKQLAGK